MTPSNEIRSRIVRVIVSELGANLTEQDLQGATRLDEVVAMDSLGLLKFALGLEREFGISFERESFDREFLLNLTGLAAYLEQRSRTSSR
jgi:acyl carrier protein